MGCSPHVATAVNAVWLASFDPGFAVHRRSSSGFGMVPWRISWARVSCICSAIYLPISIGTFQAQAHGQRRQAGKSPPSYMDSTAVLRTITIVAHLIKLCLT